MIVLGWVACTTPASRSVLDRQTVATPPEPPAAENVLVVIMDDVGTDQLALYGVQPDQAPTPNLDALAARSLRFDNAYVYPTCSPTRAALLTGRTPTRYGILKNLLTHTEQTDLPLAEVTLPEVLRDHAEGWSTALIGKWHLSSALHPGAAYSPLDQGFDHFVGTHENLGAGLDRPGGYFSWERNDDGRLDWVHGYVTTTEVDDALAFVESRPEPWFVVLSFNAAHIPLASPPPELISSPPLPADADCDGVDEPWCYRRTLEALDTEIGRLLASLGDRLDRTTLVVLGDNGSPEDVVLPPFLPGRAKGAVFDLGVRVPFLVSGPRVAAPGAVDAFVTAEDLLPSVAEIAGVDLAEVVDEAGRPVELDGESFLPLLADPSLPGRDLVFSFGGQPNGPPPLVERLEMVRDHGWKLTRVDQQARLFRYVPGALDEGEPLATPFDPEETAAFVRLQAALDARIAEVW